MVKPVTVDIRDIAKELNLETWQVEAVIELLEEGNTIPFITRYRRDRTGGLDEEQIRRIQARLNSLRLLAERKQTILRSIASQGKLTPELEKAILEADSPSRLEDLYLPYKPKKQTLATLARSRGLQKLAEEILQADPACSDLDARAADFVDPDKKIHHVADALAGAGHIIAEYFSERADLRAKLREMLRANAYLVSVAAEPPKSLQKVASPPAPPGTERSVPPGPPPAAAAGPSPEATGQVTPASAEILEPPASPQQELPASPQEAAVSLPPQEPQPSTAFAEGSSSGTPSASGNEGVLPPGEIGLEQSGAGETPSPQVIQTAESEPAGQEAAPEDTSASAERSVPVVGQSFEGAEQDSAVAREDGTTGFAEAGAFPEASPADKSPSPAPEFPTAAEVHGIPSDRPPGEENPEILSGEASTPETAAAHTEAIPLEGGALKDNQELASSNPAVTSEQADTGSCFEATDQSALTAATPSSSEETRPAPSSGSTGGGTSLEIVNPGNSEGSMANSGSGSQSFGGYSPGEKEAHGEGPPAPGTSSVGGEKDPENNCDQGNGNGGHAHPEDPSVPDFADCPDSGNGSHSSHEGNTSSSSDGGNGSHCPDDGNGSHAELPADRGSNGGHSDSPETPESQASPQSGECSAAFERNRADTPESLASEGPDLRGSSPAESTESSPTGPGEVLSVESVESSLGESGESSPVPQPEGIAKASSSESMIPTRSTGAFPEAVSAELAQGTGEGSAAGTPPADSPQPEGQTPASLAGCQAGPEEGKPENAEGAAGPQAAAYGPPEPHIESAITEPAEVHPPSTALESQIEEPQAESELGKVQPEGQAAKGAEVSCSSPVSQASPEAAGTAGLPPERSPSETSPPERKKSRKKKKRKKRSQAAPGETASTPTESRKLTRAEERWLRRRAAFRDYFNFRQRIDALAPHQILAVNRGERLGVLRVKLEYDFEPFFQAAQEICIPPDHPHAEFLRGCLRDALVRLVMPALERDIRRELTEKAEEHALKVFARNLRKLLLQPPVRDRRVLAIDPGLRSGCTAVALDEFGNVLGYGNFRLVGSPEERQKGKELLCHLIERYRIDIIAIGNGTGSRQTERFVADLLANELKDHNLRYCIVNEAGASLYSTSPIGREEFPDYTPELRSAISIGRRLQDPLSELVKIEPAHLGVGLYQHDIQASHLKSSLAEVVESCVNYAGVDVNTASVALLRYVSGLNQLTAKRIYDYRRQHGPFRNRAQLREVPGIGEATFIQAAGFLKITGGDNPLDATWIHPESYPVAEKVLEVLGFRPEDLRIRARMEELRAAVEKVNPQELARQLGLGELTLRDILSQLARPGRDPREDLPGPIFRQGILRLQDLKPGMELMGTVANVVDFGAFVDFGLPITGLVHISELSTKYVRDVHEVVEVGDIVHVWVKDVDLKRRRVSLTMIPPGTPRVTSSRKAGEKQPESAAGRKTPSPAEVATASTGQAPRERKPWRERDRRGRKPVPATPEVATGESAAGATAATSSAGTKSPEHPATEKAKPKSRPRGKETRKAPIQLSEEVLSGKQPMRSFAELAQYFRLKAQLQGRKEQSSEAEARGPSSAPTAQTPAETPAEATPAPPPPAIPMPAPKDQAPSPPSVPETSPPAPASSPVPESSEGAELAPG